MQSQVRGVSCCGVSGESRTLESKDSRTLESEESRTLDSEEVRSPGIVDSRCPRLSLKCYLHGALQNNIHPNSLLSETCVSSQLMYFQT